MPKTYEQEELRTVSILDVLNASLKGFVDTKTVRKDSRSSGIIRVPSRFIGRTFRIILIPEENVLDLNL